MRHRPDHQRPSTAAGGGSSSARRFVFPRPGRNIQALLRKTFPRHRDGSARRNRMRSCVRQSNGNFSVNDPPPDLPKRPKTGKLSLSYHECEVSIWTAAVVVSNRSIRRSRVVRVFAAASRPCSDRAHPQYANAIVCCNAASAPPETRAAQRSRGGGKGIFLCIDMANFAFSCPLPRRPSPAPALTTM